MTMLRTQMTLTATAAILMVLSSGASAAAISFQPGTYEGVGTGRNGEVKVKVTVSKNRIESIDVVSHKESAGLSDAPIKKLPKTIVEKQSLAVDAYSGATLSSKGVLGAVQDALKKATPDIKPLLAAAVAAPAIKEKDQNVDVLVVGSGVAGMMAGLAAAEQGANVLILEKQGMLGAGNSMTISTGIAGGGSALINKLGIKNHSAEDYADFLIKQARDRKIPVDEKNVRTYALRSGEVIDYLMKLGVPFTKFETFNWFHLTEDGSAPGPHIIKALSAKLEADKIPYKLNNRVTNLIVTDGRVTGAEVDSKTGSYKVHAKAVVLATGGYAANAKLVAKYAPEWINRPTTGSISNTGDGLVMAEKIGAQKATMDAYKTNHLCHPLNATDGISFTAIKDYAVLVNHEGVRFMDESIPSPNEKSRIMMKQTQHEAYAIIDQSVMDKLRLMRNYADAGYFVKADTLEGLADQIKVDKTAFVKTMKNYIDMVKQGKDSEFNRKLIHGFGKAPFYASLVTPAMQATSGGIKTDENAQTYYENGKPINGLYAAGGVSGHGTYSNEVGWAAVRDLAFGRIAGTNAAKFAKTQK